MTPHRRRKVAFHCLFFAAVLVCIVGLRLSLRGWYAREFRAVAQRASAEGARQKERYWGAARFVDATQGQFPDAFLAKIDWGDLDVSELMSSRLRARLRDVIHYLQDPTFEEYYRLKTEGLHFSFSPNRTALFFLTNGGPRRPDVATPVEPKDVTRIVWEGVHRRSLRAMPPRLLSVCLDQLSTATSRTNTAWSLLGGKVTKGFTRAVEAPDPGFRYPTSGLSAVRVSDPLFCHMSFLAKMQGSERAGPVYITLAWLPGDGAWALGRMLTDASLGVQTVF